MKKFFKIQSGRSMMEMLGVLAIIGVLSALAFWGYRQAMNRYKAGKVLSDVRMYHALIEHMSMPFDEDGNSRESEFKPQTEFGFVAEENKEEGYYTISIVDLPEDLCQTVLTVAGSNPFENTPDGEARGASKVAVKTEDGLSFEWSNGNNTGICHEGNNEVMFFFGTVEGICRSTCIGDEHCYYGTCCLESKKCNGSCCAEGEICCNGACRVPDCPTDSNGVQLEMNGACVCQCPTGQGFEPELQNGACKCNPANGFTLKNGVCTCPDGQVNVNGKCTMFGCFTSDARTAQCTSGISCYCYIGDERCGYNCSPANLEACYYGMCTDRCLGNDWVYDSVTKTYVCATNDGRFFCTVRGGTSMGAMLCYEQGKSAIYSCGRSTSVTNHCNADGSGCPYGDCTNVCTGRSFNGVAGTYGQVGGYWGCIYGDVRCVKQNNRYYCYKNGSVCAQYCKNPYPDSTCSTNTCADTSCPEGTEMGSDGRCTRSDGVYCKLGYENSGYWCYLPNDELCGKTCDKDGTNCTTGCCDGGNGSLCCPSGYKYQKLSGYYGCYSSTTNIGCWNTNKAKTAWGCELNGVRCGTSCSVAGASCTSGSCDPSVCTSKGLEYTTPINSYYGGCINGDLKCYKADNSGNYTCLLGSTQCGTGCSANYDGLKKNSTTAACTSGVNSCGGVFTCPNANQTLLNESTKGCTNPNGVTCRTDGNCYVNYGGSGYTYQCGSGCNTTKLDGSGCTKGVCDPMECDSQDSWVYNTSTALYECQHDGRTLSCNNGICQFGDSKCGANCTKGVNGPQCHDGAVTCTIGDVKCASGVCSSIECGGSVTIARATSDFFGCDNENNMVCYPNAGTIYCVQNTQIVGKDCNMDGTGCKCLAGRGKAIVEPGDGTSSVDADDYCTLCPKATCSSSNGTSCGGSVSVNQVCMKCPQGTYNGNAGQSSCSKTSIGYYNTGTGNTSQKACPAGTTTAQTGTYDNPSECTPQNPVACGCQAAGETVCTQNSDCTGEGEFCWFSNNSTCYSSKQGQCKKVANYKPETKTMSDGKTWTRGGTSMNWWSVQNWCKAQGLHPVSRSDLGCQEIVYPSWCTHSDTYAALKGTWKESRTYWLEDYGNACSAFYTTASDTTVGYTNRFNSYYPLCKP